MRNLELRRRCVGEALLKAAIHGIGGDHLTSFMIITSALNIGLGYALAVYLGQARLPGRGNDRRRNCDAAPQADVADDAAEIPTEITAADPNESALTEPIEVAATPPDEGDVATSAPHESLPMVEDRSTEGAPAAGAVDVPITEEAEDVAAKEAANQVEVDEEVEADPPPAADDAEHAVTSDQVEATFERVSSDLETTLSEPDDTASASPLVDVDATSSDLGQDDGGGREVESEIVESTAAATDSVDAEPAATGADEEDMLRGLEDFRAQLQQQSAATDEASSADLATTAADAANEPEPTPPESDAEAASPSQAVAEQQVTDTLDSKPVEMELGEAEPSTTRPPDGEDALAGIEAFRAQLAAMQNDPSENDNDDTEQEVAAEAAS